VKKITQLCLSTLILLVSSVLIAAETQHIKTQQVANTQGAVKALQLELGAVTSFSARFSQSTQDGLGNTLQTVNGFMQVAKPGKLRWQTEGLYEQLVISDGQSLWIYDADLEQVSIKNMDNRLSETPALLLGGDISAIDDDFIVTQSQTESKVLFILQPKDSSQLFDSLELSFYRHKQNNILQQMVIRDASGQITDISFSEAEKNPSLQADLFHFEIPAGVDVIDGRQGRY
jgi:outer membrane lipoprotein carrier protein